MTTIASVLAPREMTKEPAMGKRSTVTFRRGIDAVISRLGGLLVTAEEAFAGAMVCWRRIARRWRRRACVGRRRFGRDLLLTVSGRVETDFDHVIFFEMLTRHRNAKWIGNQCA